MQRILQRFNTKRKIMDWPPPEGCDIVDLMSRISYGGNPEHKRAPGDFGLTPQSSPRPAKSLCDTVKIFDRSVATAHLKAGLAKGMFSVQMRGEWPQNIWAVTEDGTPLEAQLENSATGVYHGYPMPESDPFSLEVIQTWQARP